MTPWPYRTLTVSLLVVTVVGGGTALTLIELLAVVLGDDLVDR